MSIDTEPTTEPDVSEMLRTLLRANPDEENEWFIGRMKAAGVEVTARQVAGYRRGMKGRDDSDRYSGDELQAAVGFIRRVGGIRRANALLAAFSALDDAGDVL